MTDLRSLTILGLMARILPEIDGGDSVPPADIQDAIANRTILQLLKKRYGDYPEFSPIHKAESALLQKELRQALEALDGREASKLGVEKNGLCFLLAYCMELLVHRNLKEVLG